MEQNKFNNIIADRLHKLPKKINMHQSSDVIAECILWELSHEMCLHSSSVAYFIYNPDFLICKGLAGMNHNDLIDWCAAEPWHDMENFEKIIKDTSFNKKIRSIEFNTKKNTKSEEVITQLKSYLNDEYLFYSWKIKNNNYGILAYKSQENYSEEDLCNAVEYLSFH